MATVTTELAEFLQHDADLTKMRIESVKEQIKSKATRIRSLMVDFIETFDQDLLNGNEQFVPTYAQDLEELVKDLRRLNEHLNYINYVAEKIGK